MDVREYLNVLARRRRLVALVLLATLGAAVAFVMLSPHRWTAGATIRVEPGTAVVGGSVRQDDISYLDRLVNTYAKVATSRHVAGEVARELRSGTAPEVAVVPVPSTNLMDIDVTAPDARTAVRAANAVAAMLIEEVQRSSSEAALVAERSFQRRTSRVEADIARATVELERLLGTVGDREAELRLRERIRSGRASLEAERETYESYQAAREARSGAISLITPATSASQTGRSIEQVAAVALILGAIAAAGLAFVAENMSGSFRSRAEIEESIQSLVIAAIPRVHGAGRRSTFNGGSRGEEAFRRLRTQVLLQARDDTHTILVTSAEPGEGKSTVVANLGRSLAQSGRSVVLVDADLRTPRLHTFFGEPAGPGLSDLLRRFPDAGVPSEGRGSNGQRADAVLLRRFTQVLRAQGPLRRTELAAAVGHEANGGTFGRSLKLGLSSGVLATSGKGDYLLTEQLDEEDQRWVPNELGLRHGLDTPGLALLPAGSPADDPPTLLGSRAAERLLDSLSRTCDFVLVDSPALLAVPDALALRHSVDEVLLVARSTVQRDTLRLAHDELVRAGVHPLGVVLNSASDRGLYPYLDSAGRKENGGAHAAGVEEPAQGARFP